VYKQLPLTYRILLFFFLTAAFIDALASVMGIVFHNNMPLQHLQSFIELLIFSFVYYVTFKSKRVLQVLILLNAAVFIAVAMVDAFLINGLCRANTISRPYAAISILCYALIYLYFLFSSDDMMHGKKHPMFWINTGALIYFGNNIFYFLLINNMVDAKSIGTEITLWAHAALNIIANCLYAQAFRCFKKQTAVS
jgi:hypothetical protein